MLPYLVFILATLFLSLAYDGKEVYRGGKKVWYILMCLYLILLAGIRYKVGGDSITYLEAFDDVPTSPSDYYTYIVNAMLFTGHMPGWTIINIICKHYFNSFYAVQIVQAIIVNVCIFYIFQKYTRHIFLCALLYFISFQFFNFNTEVMREAIAIGLCSIGMYKYLRGDKITFYVLAAISITCFHLSALIILLFPFTQIKHFSINTIVIAFFCAFVLWIFSDFIIFRLWAILPNQETILESKVSSYGNISSNIFGFLMKAIQLFVGEASMIYFSYKNIGKNEDLEKDYTYYIGFFIIISVLVCGITGTFRFLNYTKIFVIIMFTEYVYGFKKQLTNLPAAKIFILAICLYFPIIFWFQYYPNSDGHRYDFYTPYSSYFKESDSKITNLREHMHKETLQRNSGRKQ